MKLTDSKADLIVSYRVTLYIRKKSRSECRKSDVMLLKKYCN
jgi:hypothetical protein